MQACHFCQLLLALHGLNESGNDNPSPGSFPIDTMSLRETESRKSPEELQIDVRWHHSLINTDSSLYISLKKMTWEKIVEFVKQIETKKDSLLLEKTLDFLFLNQKYSHFSHSIR